MLGGSGKLEAYGNDLFLFDFFMSSKKSTGEKISQCSSKIYKITASTIDFAVRHGIVGRSGNENKMIGNLKKLFSLPNRVYN